MARARAAMAVITEFSGSYSDISNDSAKHSHGVDWEAIRQHEARRRAVEAMHRQQEAQEEKEASHRRDLAHRRQQLKEKEEVTKRALLMSERQEKIQRAHQQYEKAEIDGEKRTRHLRTLGPPFSERSLQQPKKVIIHQ